MPGIQLVESELTASVIGGFYAVYNVMGFGYAEHLYSAALERELTERGHRVNREVAVDVFYKTDKIGVQRLDMIVDDRLVIEVKSTFKLHEAAPRQVFSYLRCTNLEVGLLLHFGPKAGFFRLWCPNNSKGKRYHLHR